MEADFCSPSRNLRAKNEAFSRSFQITLISISKIFLKLYDSVPPLGFRVFEAFTVLLSSFLNTFKAAAGCFSFHKSPNHI